MTTPIERRSVGREGATPLVAALAAWEPFGGHVAGLHAGDVGWHLRLPDDHVEGRLHGWWRDDRLVAVALVDGVIARPRLAPDCLGDREVCEAVAGLVDAMPGDEAWTDAAPGSLLRTLLVARGWDLDRDVWVSLHLSFSAGWDELAPGVLRAAAAVEGVAPTASDQDVHDRVSVQPLAFTHSTPAVDGWHRMAAGTGFDPALDLLARDSDGRPVAAATAWSSGRDKCGILEPVGTHREHRDHGHGRRVVLAAIDALHRAGASGVALSTPGRNQPGIAMFRSCGLRPVESLQALTREP